MGGEAYAFQDIPSALLIQLSAARHCHSFHTYTLLSQKAVHHKKKETTTTNNEIQH